MVNNILVLKREIGVVVYNARHVSWLNLLFRFGCSNKMQIGTRKKFYIFYINIYIQIKLF